MQNMDTFKNSDQETRFTTNPNVVANMKVNDYFKRKANLETVEHFPEVDFIAIPTIHRGKDRAEEVIDFLEKTKGDILLLEDILAYTGTKDEVKKEYNKSNSSHDFDSGETSTFYNTLIGFCRKKNIPCDTYENKKFSVQDVMKNIEECKDSYSFLGGDFSAYYDSGDVDGAFLVLKKAMNESGSFFDFQGRREFLMLNSIGPNIYNLIRKNKNLLQKDKVRVVYFIGAAHEETIIDAMSERGDSVKVEKVKDFADFKIKKESLVNYFLPSIFLVSFIKEFSQEFDLNQEVVALLQSDDYLLLIAKQPRRIVDAILKAKKEADPVQYFVDQINHLILDNKQ